MVDGDAVDPAHCTVRILRFNRDNIDSPEGDGVRDAELEWELISRVEPERAARMRQEASAAGVELPR